MMRILTDKPVYGEGDSSFQAAGGEEGLRRLCRDFYAQMDERPDARRIRAMHPRDLEESTDKLARFLCGWLGGPHRYNEKYGPIKIPMAHEHLNVTETERDAWLACMRAALVDQPMADDFKAYLLRELAVPAERVRVVSQRRRSESEERRGGEA